MGIRWVLVLLLLDVLGLTAKAQTEAETKALASRQAPAEDTLARTVVPTLKDSRMKVAYQDALQILSAANQCSDFYGGPRIAPSVLNELVAQVRYSYLPIETSFEMKGSATYVKDVRTGATFRRFETVIVNYNGSFFRDRGPDFRHLPRVGSFSANSRAARVLVLLHELGHMIRRSNGNWLIPDDGRQSYQSNQNTRLIERTCANELRLLDR